MSKVIAVIDKPNDCSECVFGVCEFSRPISTHIKGYYCNLKEPQDRVVEEFDFDEEVHLSNCPLRELPQKKKTDFKDWDNANRIQGYNACIDEILKVGNEV